MPEQLPLVSYKSVCVCVCVYRSMHVAVDILVSFFSHVLSLMRYLHVSFRRFPGKQQTKIKLYAHKGNIPHRWSYLQMQTA